MLVLFETPLGFCLFKFNDGKFSSDDLWKEFETPERASAAYVISSCHCSFTAYNGRTNDAIHPNQLDHRTGSSSKPFTVSPQPLPPWKI